LYLWRFSSVHIGGPSANQASSFESKRLTRFKKFRNGHSGPITILSLTGSGAAVRIAIAAEVCELFYAGMTRALDIA